MPGRTNEQSILTNLNATDFLATLRPTSGNDVAAGATDNLTQLATLAAFVFGNISVIENTNGVSIRVPGVFQACWAYLTLAGLAAGESLEHVWQFPEAFPSSSPLPIVIPAASTTSNFPRSVTVASGTGDWTRESVKLFVRDGRSAGSSVSNRVMVAAISKL